MKRKGLKKSITRVQAEVAGEEGVSGEQSAPPREIKEKNPNPPSREALQAESCLPKARNVGII